MVDIATVTNTAKAIADMNFNQEVTLVLLAVVAIINAIAIFIQRKA